MKRRRTARHAEDLPPLFSTLLSCRLRGYKIYTDSGCGYSERGVGARVYTEGSYSCVHTCIYDWIACMCDANHPCDQKRQGIVFICIYIGEEEKEREGGGGKPPDSLSCTLTRRRFPIFQPKLSTEKPSDSPSSLSFSRSRSDRHPLSRRDDSRMQRQTVIFGQNRTYPA